MKNEKVMQEVKKKYLKDVPDNKIRIASKNVVLFLKIYNRLCHTCKTKIKKNPTMPWNEYCEKCQNMAETLSR